MVTVEETLKERGARYGDFMGHALVAQALLDIMRKTTGWELMEADQRQAVGMFCDKMARIGNGDPDYVDNWRDIAGYATLVMVRLEADAAHPVEALPFSGGSPKQPHSSEDQSK